MEAERSNAARPIGCTEGKRTSFDHLFCGES
jgi:hypothetical protein